MKPFSFLGKLNPLAPVKGWLAKHKWIRRLLWLTPILIVLAVLNPVIGTVDKLFALVGRLLSPMLETGVGRAVLGILVVLLVAAIVYAFFKERVLDAFRRYGLSMQLRGLEARLLGRPADAARAFRAVTRLGRFVDLGKGSASSHGSLLVAARLELARLRLAEGEARRARSELARIPRKHLTKRQKLAVAELEARVAIEIPGGIAANAVRKLREAHEAWPAHPGIAELLAHRLEADGDRESAATVLRDTLRKVSKIQAPRIQKSLARLELRLSEDALLLGELPLAQKHVDRALRLDESEEAMLQKANLLLAREDLDGALRILGDLGTPAAKARAQELLRAQDIPLDAAKLLERMPRRGSLLSLAEYWYEGGDLRRARRSLEIVLRDAESPSPRALALLASIRMEEDAPDDARTALGKALLSLGDGVSDDEDNGSVRDAAGT